MKMTSWFIWQEVIVLLKRKASRKPHLMHYVSFLQAAAEVDMEQFDGNPLNYQYIMALFAEVVETKIEKPRGRLTRLIKFTTGEARELIKHCIHLPRSRSYQHARALLERTYCNSHKIISERNQAMVNNFGGYILVVGFHRASVLSSCLL